MSLPEKEVYQLLVSNHELVAFLDEVRGVKTDFPYIFIGTPNDTFTTYENAPWIRITPIAGDWFDSADNNRFLEYPRLQIDFWIDKAKLDELEKLEAMIYDTLHSAGLERYYKEHVVDADMPTLEMVQGNFEGLLLTDNE